MSNAAIQLLEMLWANIPDEDIGSKIKVYFDESCDCLCLIDEELLSKENRLVFIGEYK
jgi:hypothetical protein